MNIVIKRWLLFFLTVVACGSIFLFKPIAQNPDFHDFADQRLLWGILNFANVLSNIFFLFVGAIGLHAVFALRSFRGIHLTYAILFFAIFLTGLGSAYYHFTPNNNSLVFDRIPLTIVFMSLLSATIAELVDYKTGMRVLIPLLVVGVGSVLWWHYGELRGKGDLRLYGLVQFYPMVFIPLIIFLFYDPAYRNSLRPLSWVVAWYGIAKILEFFDSQIYNYTGFVSGHTLKHLAAAISTGYLIIMFRRKYNSSHSCVVQH